ncbi:nucleic acid binding [Ascochyta rabiei]|uniref:Polyadenylate-binding protein, cytoplasmic and nuclear n=1 Tax=Didymella rabiei TaxID=5454 RepID=A0A162WUF7_DIDRA|nr:nucleic acid binding [Ascochyta rabiei]
MGDVLAPLPVVATSSDEMALNHSNRSAVSSAGSDKTITSPPAPNSTAVVEPQLGPGSAMFSTDLGRRAPRKLQGPPYAPVIARSDMVQGVLIAAAGWQIGDLWDEEDIHLETESFCKELLRFIEYDVYVRAKKYAQDWSRVHPERLCIVGGDMTDLYDTNNHLSVVDNIFVNGEQQEYPPIFLWHVAHTMRAAILEIKGVRLQVKAAVGVPKHLDMEHEEPVVDGTAQVPATAKGTTKLPTAPSTRINSSTHIVVPSPSMPIPQPVPSYHGRRSSPHVPFYGTTNQGGRYTEPVGHMVAGVPGHQMGGLNLVHPGLRIPKTRSGRSASSLHEQSIPSGPYIENMPYGPSGSYSRQPTGSLSMVQSPRFNPAHMTIHYPMVNMSHSTAPFAYEQNLVAPGMIAGQPLHPGIVHPSMMPLHSTQSTSMMHGYIRQTSGSYGPSHATPMGDMTNMHFSSGMVPYDTGHRHPGGRHYSQTHGNGSALYDPYEGNNPAFKTGKKSYQGGFQHGFQNSNGRPRKASIPGSRPYHTQYTNDRSSNAQPSGHRFPGPKGLGEDDPAITQDHEHGCHIDWIGPQNTTVTDVFIKNLPGDVQDAELEELFQNRIGSKPKSINTRNAFQAQHIYPNRKHAFVGFSTTAIARQALGILNPAIRGLPVSITVPKRFFQNIVEVPMRDAVEAGPPSNSRYFSHAKNYEARNRGPSTNEGSDTTATNAVTKDNLSYSPQDARSDLHKKKKKGKPPQQGSAVAGSPEAQKTKPKKRQESPNKKKPVEPTPAAQNNTTNETTEMGDEAPAHDTAKETSPAVGTQIEQSQTDRDPSSKPGEEISPTAAADAYTLFGDYTLGVSNSSCTFSKTQQQQVAPQKTDPNPQQETPKVNAHSDNTKQGTAKAPNKAKRTPVTTDPLGVGGLISDNELKNDANFRSAAESQADLEQKVEPGADFHVTNQGTTAPSPKITKYSISGNISPTPHTTSERRTANPATEKDTMAAVTGNNPLGSEVTESAMSTADPEAVDTSVAVQPEAASYSASPDVAGLAKRTGAQHTESLHPFSKASKAQAKKEREQKRKALRKKKEQAEKARAAKASATKLIAKSASTEKGESSKEKGIAPVSGTTDKIDITAENESAQKSTTSSVVEDPSAPTQDVSESGSPAKKPVSAVKIAKRIVDSCDQPEKLKEKKMDTTATSAAAVARSKNDDHGKQPGSTVSIPLEAGSVTKKEVKFDLPGDDLALGAPSPDLEGTKTAFNVAKESISTATTGVGLSKSAKRRKKKKLRRVWPSLEFRPRSPNPEWMGPIDMENDTHDYDSIMNEACGGEDDSDFSWDDLPRVSSEDDQSSSVTDEDGDDADDGDDAKNEILKRIADLEAQKAAAVLVSMRGIINTGQQKQTLGEALYPKVQELQPELAGKITHMLLDLDNSELLNLISDGAALRAKVDEAMSIHDEHIKKNGEGKEEALIETETLEPNADVEEEDIQQGLAASKARIGKSPLAHAQWHRLTSLAMINEETAQRTDTQEPSAGVVAGSQPTKKKKNKHKKRKKQQQPDAAVEAAIDTVNAAGSTETEKSTSKKPTNDPIDTDDPFYDQLKDIDAIKRGETGAASTQDTRSQHHAEIAKSLKDPQFMRTMEGYLKETQGTSQSKGRKVSKDDLF